MIICGQIDKELIDEITFIAKTYAVAQRSRYLGNQIDKLNHKYGGDL